LNGWTVCRFHGARGGAPRGIANGSYKHGLYTKEAKAVCRLVSDLLAQDDRKHRMNEKARPGGNIRAKRASQYQPRLGRMYAERGY
jgi:hypothetical protein